MGPQPLAVLGPALLCAKEVAARRGDLPGEARVSQCVGLRVADFNFFA